MEFMGARREMPFQNDFCPSKLKLTVVVFEETVSKILSCIWSEMFQMCNFLIPYTNIPYKACPSKVSPRSVHGISNWVSQGFGTQYYHHADKLIYNVIELEQSYQKQLYSDKENSKAINTQKIFTEVQ